jgi:hypothetical protein
MTRAISVMLLAFGLLVGAAVEIVGAIAHNSDSARRRAERDFERFSRENAERAEQARQDTMRARIEILQDQGKLVEAAKLKLELLRTTPIRLVPPGFFDSSEDSRSSFSILAGIGLLVTAGTAFWGSLAIRRRDSRPELLEKRSGVYNL